MSDYRKYDRIKDWVEELLEGIVIRQIVSDLINEQIGGCVLRLGEGGNL